MNLVVAIEFELLHYVLEACYGLLDLRRAKVLAISLLEDLHKLETREEDDLDGFFEAHG
jgi:hypothetical protein